MKHGHIRCAFRYMSNAPHDNTRGVIVIKGISHLPFTSDKHTCDNSLKTWHDDRIMC